MIDTTIFLIGIFITGYTLFQARINFKEKNIMGGIAIAVLSVITMACPFVFVIFIK